MRKLLYFAATCVSFALTGAPAMAAVLFEHVGANDPATEGFTPLLATLDQFGPVSPDSYDGVTDAW